MASSPSTLFQYSLQEYLAMENAADFRSEYFNGQIVAMAGASPAHIWITGNLFASLHTFLRDKSCRVAASDMRIMSAAANSITYPDIVVACDPVEVAPGGNAAILNPLLIIEVLSPSTEKRDRQWKFGVYKQIPSFQQYALVSQTEPFIEIYSKTNNGFWIHSAVEGLESAAEFSAFGATVPMSEIYSRVEFPS